MESGRFVLILSRCGVGFFYPGCKGVFVKVFRSILLWIIAFLLTASAAIYQRRTGPTYPLDGVVTLAGRSIPYSMLRTQERSDLPVMVDQADTAITGVVRWKRFKYDEPWRDLPMQRVTLHADSIAKLSGLGHSFGKNRGGVTGATRSILLAWLPMQPPAGKLEYQIVLSCGTENVTIPKTSDFAVIRFKGAVPTGILVPHVFCMFFGLLFGMRIMLGALAKEKLRGRMWVALALLTVGGFILGPIVQKYAFGAYWTGWPFGEDLTDNKTAAMVFAWAFALWITRNSSPASAKRFWTIPAAIVMITVYLIPHSMRGSTLDYKTLEKQNRIEIKTGAN